MIWTVSWRFDPGGCEIADRHYNRQTPDSPQFVPPGKCLVLRCPGAIWVTSWQRYVRHAWAGAWVNSLFRREPECPERASTLIRHAVAATRWQWPDVPALGIVTFVDPSKVRRKRDPGRCYLRAGWRFIGMTQRGLLAFGQLEPEMPSPEAAVGAQFSLILAGA